MSYATDESLNTVMLRGPLVRPAGRSLSPRWCFLAVLLAAVGTMEPAPVFLGFLALLGSCILFSGLRVAAPPLRFTLPIVLIVGIGLLSAWVGRASLGSSVGTRDVIRDAWRYGEPAVLVVVGWSMVRRREDLDGLIAAIFLGAALTSTQHLFGAFLNLESLDSGRDAFRKEVGSGSFLSALTLAIAAGFKLERIRDIRMPAGLLQVSVAICAASLLISFSRTWMLACGVITLVILIRRSGFMVSAGTGTLTAAALLAGILLAVPEEVLGLANGGLKDALVETMTARSFVEPAELNRFWRSYEAWCALERMGSSGPWTLLLGDGLGSRLDLGLYQMLDGKMLREIPVMHNGYLESSMKAGLVGTAIYVFWLCAWIRSGLEACTHEPRARLVSSLCLGLVLVLVGTGQVVGGAFNPRATAGLVVLLAAFVRWNSIVLRQHRKGQQELSR